MDIENKKSETKPGSDSATVQSAMKRGAEVLGQAEHAVSDAYDKTAHVVSETYDKTAHAVSGAYDKTAHAVSETYDHAKSYSNENPGKSILIALGIGVGLGILLGANSHRSRSGRFAEPVVNALSDIALAFFH